MGGGGGTSEGIARAHCDGGTAFAKSTSMPAVVSLDEVSSVSRPPVRNPTFPEAFVVPVTVTLDTLRHPELSGAGVSDGCVADVLTVAHPDFFGAAGWPLAEEFTVAHPELLNPLVSELEVAFTDSTGTTFGAVPRIPVKSPTFTPRAFAIRFSSFSSRLRSFANRASFSACPSARPLALACISLNRCL